MATFDRRRMPADAAVETWTAHDGWALRTVTLPGAGRGTLLFAGGLGDFVEKNIEPVAHWRARGWTVRAFDWRGQGRSGRLGPRGVSHVHAFDDHVRDAVGLLAAARADGQGPIAAIGHSMGGHLLLRVLAEGGAVDAGVLVAPLLGINSMPLPAALARPVAAGVARWRAERGVWRGERAGRARAAFAPQVLTHCPERFSDEGWWRAQDPDLASGPPTWGWLAAAYASMRRLAPGVLAEVRTPLLLLAAPRDRLVSTPAIRRAAAALPDAELVVVPQAAHELLREADGPREHALRAIDDFLDRRAPPG